MDWSLLIKDPICNVLSHATNPLDPAKVHDSQGSAKWVESWSMYAF